MGSPKEIPPIFQRDPFPVNFGCFQSKSKKTFFEIDVFKISI